MIDIQKYNDIQDSGTQWEISRGITVLWASFFLIAASIVVAPVSVYAGAYLPDASGMVSMEVENADTNTPLSGRSWDPVSSPAGFSGTSALRTLPDAGLNISSGYAATSPHLEYLVDFTQTGTHYIWIRGHGPKGGSDSVHAGIDGQEVPSASGISVPRVSGYDWTSTKTINVSTPGVHVIDIWMREDGTVIDKIVMSPNLSDEPTGLGPPESPRDSGGNLAPVFVNPPGDQNVEAGQLLTVMVTADDPDGPSAPTLNHTGGPGSESSNVDNGDGTRTLTWTWTPVDPDDIGSYQVTFTATDPADPLVTTDLVINVTVNAPGGGTGAYLPDASGMVSMEVENADTNTPLSGRSWDPVSSPAGFSGTSALRTLPDAGLNISTGYAATSPHLEYLVDFTQTGTHYIWIRGHGPKGGSDSVHAGIDGQEVPSASGISVPRVSGYDWTSTKTINVSTPGVHVIDIWMREDGTVIDKIVMSPNLSDEPTGLGPPESPRDSGGNQPPIWNPLPDPDVEAGQTLVVTVTATDPDLTTPILSASNLPTGALGTASFVDNGDGSGTLTWPTEDPTDIGSYPGVTFTATDATDPLVTTDLVVTINVTAPPANQPPVWDPLPDPDVEAGQTLVVTVTATDPDLTTPILSASNLPTGALGTASFVDNGDGSGTLTWPTEDPTDIGSYPGVTFTATDATDPLVTTDLVVTINVTAPGGGGSGSGAYLPDALGLLSMEVENADTNTPLSGRSWDPVSSPPAGFSGTGVLQALPDSGLNISSGYAATSPHLEYLVDFTQTGTHYIWIRGEGIKNSSDSVHAGIDGQEVATTQAIWIPHTAYGWTSAKTINVSTPGVHVIDIWMREDGTVIDKIVMSPNLSDAPTGLGPPESPRDICQSTPAVSIDSPQPLHIQSSTDLTVEATACLDPVTHSGWGVKFILDEGTPEESVVFDYTEPHEVTFSSVGKAEHTAKVQLVDSGGTPQAGSNNEDEVQDIGVGDYTIVMGDSIHAGAHDTDPTDDVCSDGRVDGGGYPPVLCTELNNRDLTAGGGNFPHFFGNDAVSGDKSADGVALISGVLANHPEAQRIIFGYGINDARPGNPTPSGLGLNPGDGGYPGSYKDNMQQMIDAANAAGLEAILPLINIALGDCADPVSCPPYPDPETGARTVNIQELNQVINEIRSEMNSDGDPTNDITVVPPDFYGMFNPNVGNGGQYDDNIHPNGEGYKTMVDGLPGFDGWIDVLCPSCLPP